VPGFLPQSPAAADDTVEATAPEAAVAEGPADGPDTAADGTEAGTADSAADTAEPTAPDTEDAEDADDTEPAGPAEEDDRGEPLFEISDRRATILADKVGIVFRLDEEEADFTWEEIGAVEIDTPRFGKRFKVTVYTGPRRWFESHVEATSRGQLKKWTAELDAVLDEHFEDPDAAKEEDPKDEEAAEEAAAEDAPEATAPDADAEDAGSEAEEAAEAADEATDDAEDAPEAGDKDSKDRKDKAEEAKA
jgi:hypothetical protein